MLDYRDLRRGDDRLARWKDDADREAVRKQDSSDVVALEQQATAPAQMAELQAEVEALKAHCEERLREIAETVIETVDNLRDGIENLHAKSSTLREQVANAASREELDRRLESERSARASAITNAVAKCQEQLARNEQRALTSEQQMFAAIVSRFLGHGVAVKVPMLRGTYDPRTTYSALDVIAKDGGIYIAKQDAPGTCPGEGWQIASMRGERGRQGERGLPGAQGPAGAPGVPAPQPIGFEVDTDNYMVKLRWSDAGVTLLNVRPLFEAFAAEIS
jgi:hypothetical protein